MKHIAIYVRVSSSKQDTASQMPDLKRWAEAQSIPIKWYEDTASGKSMNRPSWNKLESAIRDGQIETLVVWRIDRLGRTVKGLAELFERLGSKKVNLISLRDGFDLATAPGRLMANVLASIAQFEREVNGERTRAGIEAARRQGKQIGGSKPGVRKVIKPEKERAIITMKANGETIASIARVLKISRPSVYDVLRTQKVIA